jgi:hypothetical protein
LDGARIRAPPGAGGDAGAGAAVAFGIARSAGLLSASD